MVNSTFVNEEIEMKDVNVWLKSLRLHKYSELFSKLSYQEMMVLTEEELEKKGVTKGARHKIILNINKLKNRSNNLKALEQSLEEEGHYFVRQALNELKSMLFTPIKPFTHDFRLSSNINNQFSPNYRDKIDGDLPSQLTRVLGKSK